LPQGFEINSDQTVLTFNPAKAAKTTELTVTLKLANHPAVSYSQDITATVEDAVAAVNPIRIPKMTINTMINQ